MRPKSRLAGLLSGAALALALNASAPNALAHGGLFHGYGGFHGFGGFRPPVPMFFPRPMIRYAAPRIVFLPPPRPAYPAPYYYPRPAAPPPALPPAYASAAPESALRHVVHHWRKPAAPVAVPVPAPIASPPIAAGYAPPVAAPPPPAYATSYAPPPPSYAPPPVATPQYDGRTAPPLTGPVSSPPPADNGSSAPPQPADNGEINWPLLGGLAALGFGGWHLHKTGKLKVWWAKLKAWFGSGHAPPPFAAPPHAAPGITYDIPE
jgi:hypothetical protein